ncbi:uncharacterized protein EAE98_006618 [Botrytis deweyae]|uniref:NADH:ubiquinone oxidoreductase intermediate-associated protein 30 domain-containing protein n=1 Tax=Botrytis deweyae TaxID=2478750 RepID=A0ABQ7IJU9_9HELO|nr:uncharacterized protein EAE98_006618 [Botrytis deweyae]KAF7926323.1 hypothetical protein EAE98_006618 [Botrytis deweyae]
MTSRASLNPPTAPRSGRVLGPNNNPPDDLCLHNRKIGKVRVDCKFQLSRSKWGVLGHAENPAGIIYMSLGFHQPGDCRLSQATVSVTFKEYKGGNRSDETLSSSLHITNRFGPRHLVGEERKVSVKESVHFTPNFTVLGNGGGGVGFDRVKDYVCSSRWNFKGQLIPADHPNQRGHQTGVHRTLKWELTESDLETEATHSDVIYTAFAFKHAGDAFYMEVKIEGKLKSPKDRIRRYLKFSSRAKESKAITLLVDPPRKNGSSPQLDALADGLPRAMEIENLLAVPKEMPHAVPTFVHPGGIAANTSGPSINRAIINPVEQSRATNGSPTLIQGVSNPSLGDPTYPSVENLTKALSVFVDRRQQNAQNSTTKPEKSTLKPVEEAVELESELKTDIESSYSSSDTKLVNEEDPELNHENLAIIKKKQIDEETMLRLFESPCILFIIRMLLRVAGLFRGVTKLLEKPPSFVVAKQNFNGKAKS